MTHPEIKEAELFGYPLHDMPSEPIGKCEFCGDDIYSKHAKSSDGLFCDLTCCHNYYEIEEDEEY